METTPSSIAILGISGYSPSRWVPKNLSSTYVEAIQSVLKSKVESTIEVEYYASSAGVAVVSEGVQANWTALGQKLVLVANQPWIAVVASEGVQADWTALGQILVLLANQPWIAVVASEGVQADWTA